MHPRAFIRSFCLSKLINGLLTRNSTMFSIRIRNGELYHRTAPNKKNGELFYRYEFSLAPEEPICISGPSSILPFTFQTTAIINGGFAYDLCDKMKHPFESIEDMQFLGGEKVRWRPWMINVGCVRFLRETDDEDVELVELLEPQEATLSKGTEGILMNLMNSAMNVHFITHDQLGEVVQIIFEEREKREPVQKEDFQLPTYSYFPTESTKKPVGRLRTERGVGTDVETKEVGSGPSVLMVNSGTSYEIQKLDATRLHRAANDPKLAAFLNNVLPLFEDELRLSDLQSQLAAEFCL